MIELDLLMKLVGALGLMLIIAGLLKKKKKQELYFFLSGGIALAIYSFYIQDLVFIILQIVYVIVTTYELIGLRKTKLF